MKALQYVVIAVAAFGLGLFLGLVSCTPAERTRTAVDVTACEAAKVIAAAMSDAAPPGFDEPGMSERLTRDLAQCAAAELEPRDGGRP